MTRHQCRIPLKAKKATGLGFAPQGAPGPLKTPLKSWKFRNFSLKKFENKFVRIKMRLKEGTKIELQRDLSDLQVC